MCSMQLVHLVQLLCIELIDNCNLSSRRQLNGRWYLLAAKTHVRWIHLNEVLDYTILIVHLVMHCK